MKQIRIASMPGTQPPGQRRFSCEWMEASLMNRWLLKTRLAEAQAAQGESSHWIETRDKERVDELAHA